MTIGILEAVAWVGYAVALVALIYSAASAPRGSAAPLWFLAASMGLMVLVSTSNSLEHLNISQALDTYEDYAEILFMPLVAYGLYGYLVTSQRASIESTRRAAESEHHMLLEIVENTPIGIAIVDQGGRIGYANPVVRELLQLKDDPSTLGFESPGKVWRTGDATEPAGILTVDPGEVVDSESCSFRTPDGEIHLLLSAKPLHPEPPYGASVVTLRPRD